MTLLMGTIGNEYIVNEILIEGATRRRLEALGLTMGTKLSVLNSKKSGSIIFKVRGTRLAVGRKIAESIVIQEVH